MATAVLDQLVGTQTAMETLLNKLRLKTETYTFNPEEKESLLRSTYFEKYFLNYLELILKNFESDNTGLLAYRLDLLEPFSKVENITKEETREFFNLLVEKLNKKDKLYDLIPELKNYPDFVVGNLPNTTASDQTSIDYLLKVIIPKLRDIHRQLIEADQKETKEEVQKATAEVKQAPDKEVDRSYVGAGLRKVKAGETQAAQPSAAESSFEDTNALVQNFGSDGVKQFFWQVERESILVEWTLAQRLFGDKLKLETLDDYIKLRNAGKSPFTNEVASYLRGVIVTELKQYSQDYFENGFNFAGTVKLADGIVGKLSHNPYFQTQLSQSLDVVFKALNIKTEVPLTPLTPPIVTQVTQDIAKNEESGENQKSYAKEAKNQFKKQIKQILAYTAISSTQSLDSLADTILDRYPNIKGLDEVDRFELQQILLPTMFSVNIDQQNKIRQGLEKVLYDRFQRSQLKVFSDDERRDFKEAFQTALVSGVTDEHELDDAVDKIFDEFEKTETISQVNAETLKKALPGDFLRALKKEDQDQVEAKILDFFKTGRLQKITPASIKSFRDAAWFMAENPQAALRALLSGYGIDSSDTASTSLLQLMDAYALKNVAPKDLEKHIKTLVDEINPQILQNKELKNFLETYISARKETVSNYTGNQFATFSDPNADSSQVFSDVVQTDTFITNNGSGEYGAEIVALAYFDPRVADWDKVEDEREKIKYERAWALRQQIIAQEQAAFRDSKDEEAKNQFAQDAGITDDKYYSKDRFGQKVLNEEGHQEVFSRMDQFSSWNAPQNAGAAGPGGMGGWLTGFNKFGKLRSAGLKKLGTQIISLAGKKELVIGGGAAGAGLAVFSILQSVAGTVGAAALGTGTTFAIVGGVIGGLPGALILGTVGAVLGGGAALVAKLSGGSASSVGTSLKLGSRTTLNNFATRAGNTARVFADTSSQLSLPSISVSATQVAVVAPIVVVSTASILSISMVMGAFLPDASTQQVAPYVSLDIEKSPYITVKKIATPTNATAPQTIHYTINVSKNDEMAEIIVITGIQDTPSAIDKDSNPLDPPQLPQSAIDALAQFTTTPVTLEKGTPIVIEFDVDATDSRFANSLVKNMIKVDFTHNGTAEDSSGIAQTCIGDCPKVIIPNCWPTLGTITQGPYGSTHAISSHKTFKEDAFDIGIGIGTKIYAAAPGIAHIGEKQYYNGKLWYYGNYVWIDHGGWYSYYAHQPDNGIQIHEGQHVDGGDWIGLTGNSGNSGGPHLHYEIRGPSQKADGSGHVMVDTFGDLPFKKTPGLQCNEYYGKN